MKQRHTKGFTLIELLVVISIISFLSSVVFSSMSKARMRARDSARIQNARQIAIALEQYETTFGTYKVASSGLSDTGSGYVARSGSGGYTNSILSSLKSAGLFSNINLKDPIYGDDNYYLGVCTSTNSYNIFVKLEQSGYNQATSSIANACGGVAAATEGFGFIASVSGGSSGGGIAGLNATGTAGFAGAMELGVGEGGGGFVGAVGALDTGFIVGTGINATVYAIKVQPDGKVLVAGDFTSYNGSSRNRIVRLNTDGSIDSSFNIGTGANAWIISLAIQSDGKIVIVGNFTSYNGTARNRIARLNVDGTLDTSFDPGSGADNGIQALALQPDGKFVIVGTFFTYRGSSSTRVARVNTDGTFDSSFNVGSGADNLTTSLAIQPDGKILIGGNFGNYNGTARTRIARINSDGSLDATFNPGFGAGNTVSNFSLQSDGKIIIGGFFTDYNSTSRYRIARLNTNGSLDTSFNPGTGANGWVLSTVIQPDGKIFVAGSFTTFNNIAKNYITRLNSDGSIDSTFSATTGTEYFVRASALQSNGYIVIGGDFTTYDGSSRNRISRIK